MDPEDNKLVVLARATAARVGAAQGAAVRDRDGRTYAAASVDLPNLAVSAVAGSLVMAVAGGSTGLEAVVVLGAVPTQADLAALRDFAGADIPVHLGSLSGSIADTLHT